MKTQDQIIADLEKRVRNLEAGAGKQKLFNRKVESLIEETGLKKPNNKKKVLIVCAASVATVVLVAASVMCGPNKKSLTLEPTTGEENGNT